MDLFSDPLILTVSISVALFAGVVKGVVGFAMPMVLISGLSTVMPAELALAGLILPTLITNGWQALRQGPRAAAASVAKFRLFLTCGLVALLFSAQLVLILPSNVMLGGIGALVVFFAGLWLSGVDLRLPSPPGRKVEAGVGTVAGFIGGMSGVWGPPTVMFLTAMDTEKREQMRVQGVIYGLGSVALAAAHLASGVVTLKTAPFSAMLVVPALVGMSFGTWLQDRIDQRAFRRATLFVLLVAGLNLLRRGVMG